MAEYSYCETLAGSGWHIRQITNQGRKLSGGADTPTLCGMKAECDIAKLVLRGDGARIGFGKSLLCRNCYRKWKNET